MQVQPYLFFDGRCDEAVDFYRTSLGAEVTALMRFKEGPTADSEEGCQGPTPVDPEKVMHGEIRIGDSVIMVSDGMAQGNPSFQGFSLTLAAKDEAEADQLFGALGDGGQVQMPLSKTFFSPKFGMVADRFGVSWMVIVSE